MQVIAKARVLIIKFVEKKSSVAFDISFDVDNGPKAVEFIKVYSGGIGSYALLPMIIAMLQVCIFGFSIRHWTLVG
ncbi:DNA polymerase sigma [Gossypium arboreum]|uniref:DNA polymerase sigma n=1 Tax=Gossypium arboreum TaxID=29729 RepID=A0A0B0MBR6_GOSAR|nr:DNA polymerase sigma [Gossypium arboreum]